MLKSLSLRRWLDIVLLSGVSVTFVKIVCQSKWLVDNFNQWAEISTGLPYFFQLIIGSFGLYCIYKVLLDFKIIHLNHWKDPALQFRYPPIYFSAILALIALFLIEDNDFPLSLEPKIAFLITIWFSVAAALSQHEKISKGAANNSSEISESINTESKSFIEYLNKKERQDLVKFHTWLHKEEPTRIDESDDFDRYVYVKRISNILLNDRSTPCHVALIGEFGSGKSSITNTIIEKITEQNNSYIFAKVDGWGRSENSCAAQILEEIVESLSVHIDCSSIKNIPKNYLDALIGSNLSGSLSIVGWIQKYHSPVSSLEKIQNILTATNKRLLIVLEDFDRQSNSKEAMSEIAALLDRLKKYDRIDFIINIGYKFDTEIIGKICTRREDISSINSEANINTLFDLMNEYESYKHPLNIEKDKSLIPQLSNDILTIIKTPRDLKQILRRAFTTWENLAGEIDIYDLLILNVIRFSKPKAFDFICINIDSFKRICSDLEFSKIDAERFKFYENSNDPDNNYIFDPINNLISRLFPKANGQFQTSKTELLKNQRIAFLGETDYFNRILRESTDDRSDVLALNKIKLLATAESSEAKMVILEISKCSFLIEKFLQYYGYEHTETKINIIDQNNIYNLLIALTNRENLKAHKNIEAYFETFHMNELMKIFIRLGNLCHMVEILKRICLYSLSAFLYLTRYVGQRRLEIPYEEIILDSLKTPKALQLSLGESHGDALLNSLIQIFMFRDISAIYLEKFMSLILETLIEFPLIKPFIEDLLEIQFAANISFEKLAIYQEQVSLIKAHIK